MTHSQMAGVLGVCGKALMTCGPSALSTSLNAAVPGLRS